MKILNQNKNTEFPLISTDDMQTLFRCFGICIACSKKCLEEGHKITAALCSECADVCALAIKAINGQFEFKEQVLALCENVCKKCSEECNKMSVKHCQECADICKQCGIVCSKKQTNY